MENHTNEHKPDEQAFVQAVNQAAGLDHRLPPEPMPIVVQLPDVERWLADE